MRRYLTAILVPIAALVLAGVALATFVQTASIHLTARRAGASTGISVFVQATDTTAPGGKPKGVRRLVIGFPAGTRFHLAAPLVKRCTLTDRQLTKAFGPSCPRDSRIGTGQAVANAMPIQAAIKERVHAYVRDSRHVILVVKPNFPGLPKEILPVTVSGSTLSLTVPKLVLGKLVSSVLVSLKLTIPAHRSGHTPLVTAGKCAGGSFTVRQTFHYADGTRFVTQSASRCR